MDREEKAAEVMSLLYTWGMLDGWNIGETDRLQRQIEDIVKEAHDDESNR